MEEQKKRSCPKCGSEDLSYVGETKLYTCKKCKHEFVAVFISYGHDDYSDLAFKIEKDLRDQGFITWIDESGLEVGEEWELRIEKGLLGTEILLLLMTPYSVRRPDGFCLNELSYASELGHKIIPIMVKKVIPPISIHRIQWLDFREWPNMSEKVYSEKFAVIINVLKGNLLSFDGTYSRLLNVLRPINFGAEIEKHKKDFYGREWIFEKVNEWFNSDSGSNVFLLTGDPGVGKSAISAMLCHQYLDCAVYHLVKYGDARKANAFECVLSLTYQLSTRIPEYAEKLMHMNIEEKIRIGNVNSLFDELIVQPLNTLENPGENVLIIIDALDEATKNEPNEIVQLIIDNFDKTPSWLKLFITTRPINKIINKLSLYNPFHLDVDEKRNMRDVQGYLERELSKLFPKTDLSEKVSLILKKSKGLFLYALHIIKEIKEDPSKLNHPEQFPKGLHGIYQMFFERHFTDSVRYDKYQRPLLSIISAAYEPIDLDLLKAILGDNDLKFKQRMEPLGSFLEIGEKGLIPFHLSLIDWLTSKETIAEFYIDVREAHNIFIDYGWTLYKKGNSEIPNYFLSYLPQHLLFKKKWKELSEILSDINYMKACLSGSLDISRNLSKIYSEVSVSKDIPETYKDVIDSGYVKFLRQRNLFNFSNISKLDLYSKIRDLIYWKRYDDAIECCDEILKIDPKNVDVLLNKANSLVNLHKYDEAIVYYDKILETDPGNVETLSSKASSLNNLQRYNKAIEYYDKALEINPRDVYALAHKASSLYNLQRYNEAIEYYDKALEINPRDVHALAHKATTLHDLQRYDEAIEYYDKALESNPRDVYALAHKGLSLHSIRRHYEGNEYYDKALKIDVNYAMAWYNKACYDSKRWENKGKAIEFLRKAIEIDKYWRDAAKDDEDFTNIRDSQEFKDLIEES